MYHLKVFIALLKMSIQSTLAYRADALVNILINVLWVGWDLLSLGIIFSNTPDLGGWGPGELVALAGIFRMLNGLMIAVIWPASEKFNASIRDGSLDYVLLQPVDSLFLTSFSKIGIWSAGDLLMGFLLLVFGLRASSFTVSPDAWAIAQFIILLFSGVLIIYSLWVVLIAATFWFIKFDNNVTILLALMDAGRYPATIYPLWLRLIVTFLIPVAVATTVPMQALRGELALWQTGLFLLVGAASFLIARRIWLAGIWQYSGASS